MKTILFPTDFSPVAENALRFAYELADRLGAGIVLFHAYHPQLMD
ncbi:MAG: universal stress protein, partial [Bacteroidetes bacterium]